MTDNAWQAFMENLDGEDDPPSVPRPPPPPLPTPGVVAEDATDEQIRAEIQRLVNGDFNEYLAQHGRKKFPSKDSGVGAMAQLILDHGQCTAQGFRDSGPRRKHAWQRFSELAEMVPMHRADKTNEQDAIYRFDYEAIRARGGILLDASVRETLTPKVRDRIYAEHDDRCSFCGDFGARAKKFQIDHAIPYKVEGNCGTHFLVACASCNRRKGFTCKGCPNFGKDPTVCYSAGSKCVWACRYNEPHTHVATVNERLIITKLTSPEEIAAYDARRTAPPVSHV